MWLSYLLGQMVLIMNLFMYFLIFIWKLITYENFSHFSQINLKSFAISTFFFLLMYCFKINMEIQKIENGQGTLIEELTGKTIYQKVGIRLIWWKMNILKALTLLIYWVLHILISVNNVFIVFCIKIIIFILIVVIFMPF